MGRKKQLVHKGLHPQRLGNMPEKVFAKLWEKHNKRQSFLNHGWTALECILNTDPDKERAFYPSPPTLSQRDAEVAATIIQWLGTNMGGCFIDEAHRLIEAEKKKEMERFKERFNKPHSRSTLGVEEEACE